MKRWSAVQIHYFQAGLYSFAIGMLLTAYTLFRVEVAGLTPLQVVLTATAHEITTFVFEVPTGVVADVVSRRLSVIIGMLVMGAALIIIALFPSFAMILLWICVWSIGSTFVSGAYDAWLVDEIGIEAAGAAFLRGAQIARVMRLAGVGLAMLLGIVSLALPILASGALTLILGLMLVLVMQETGFTPTPTAERSTWQHMWETFRSGARLIRQRPVLMSIMGISLLLGLFSEGWDQLWQVHLVESIGLPDSPAWPPIVWVGLLTLVESVAAVALAEVLRRRIHPSDGHSLAGVLSGVMLGMIGGLVIFGLARSWAVGLAGYFIFTTLRALEEPVMNTWTNQHVESSVRATVLSMNGQIHSLGEVAGGPPLGAIGQISMRAMFLVSALLLAPVLPLIAWARRHVQVRVGVGR